MGGHYLAYHMSFNPVLSQHYPGELITLKISGLQLLVLSTLSVEAEGRHCLVASLNDELLSQLFIASLGLQFLLEISAA